MSVEPWHRRWIFRLVEARKTMGLRLLWIAPRRVIRRDYLVLTKDLRGPLPEIPAHQPMRWTYLTEADISRILAINPSMSEAEIRRRLLEGQECSLGWIGGSLAHYRWETTRSTYLPFLGKTLQLEAGDIHVSDVFTHPAYRGRGIHSHTSAVGLHRARDRGLTRSIAIIAWWNAPSLRVSREAFQRTLAGTVGYWSLGPWRSYFATGRVALDDHGRIHVR